MANYLGRRVARAICIDYKPYSGPSSVIQSRTCALSRHRPFKDISTHTRFTYTFASVNAYISFRPQEPGDRFKNKR